MIIVSNGFNHPMVKVKAAYFFCVFTSGFCFNHPMVKVKDKYF